MSTQHTPQPWEAIDTLTIRGPYERGNPEKPGMLVATLPPYRKDGDARRIVACVNACASYTTEKLESGELVIVPRDEFRGYIERADQLAAQVAELVEFAQEVRRTGDTRLASMAIAVLAKVGAL